MRASERHPFPGPPARPMEDGLAEGTPRSRLWHRIPLLAALLATLALGGWQCPLEPSEPEPAIGRVTPSTLEFGAVTVGSSSDATFTITNTGEMTLSGSVGEVCEHFQVVSGGGRFDLEGDEALAVTVRFAPLSPGQKACTVDTGADACPDVSCAGTAVAEEPACLVSPGTLAFGTVPAGVTVDRSFTVTNTGTGTLSGTVSENCDHFALLSGGGAYALSGGASRTVTVRFTAPVTPGPYACAIETGSALCSDVQCSAAVAEPGPTCSVSEDALDFGVVAPGLTADRTFTITNTGGGTLSGAVSETCDEFSFVSGGGAYALSAGASRTVTVRFTAPAAPGPYACAVETGNALCSDVSCEAEVPEPDPACSVSDDALVFGVVQPGETADRSFTITNAGGGTLSGTVSESCDHYALVSGGGAYGLLAGASRTVTVRFTAPVTPGPYSCTVETGSALCPDVSCEAEVPEPDPACSVSEGALDFGVVPSGGTADRTFTITNTGGGTLSGTVSESCDHYALVSGGGAYGLLAGASRTVTVRFTAPATPGPYSCTVETGSALCADVSCLGWTPEPDPACSVSEDTLDFGVVSPGFSADRSFTITNVGGGTLSGIVSEACGHYSFVSGGGAYDLTTGSSRTVTLRFTAPLTPGPYTCTVETGSPLCADVFCLGTVPEPPPACSVSADTLDFGVVSPGGTVDLSFTVTNTGGGTLSGTVSETCDDFSFVLGGGAYALAGGASDTVTVRFTAPVTPGPYSCTVETGSALCADVLCLGTVPEPPPACSVSEDTLDFGVVSPGGTVDLSFAITNTGGGTLAGTVSETCDEFSFVLGGGAYALAGGASDTVTVRFTAPVTPGPYTCTVETGSALCADVFCVGTVPEPPPACSVSEDTLDFGTVSPGGTVDLSFTITNIGGGTLSGTVSEICDDYSLTVGEGAYDLAASQSHAVTVRFTAPATAGPYVCKVDTGNALCTGVACTGVVPE